MIEKSTLKAFLPITDQEKSKQFYQDLLGLNLILQDNFALEFDANGTALRLTLVNNFQPQNFTVLGWVVSDINLAVKELMDKKIKFEKYGLRDQDNLGIWTSPTGTKVAWFKDPDGNLLSISDH